MLQIAILGSFALKKATDFFDRKLASVPLYAPKISLGSITGVPANIPENDFFPSALDGFTKSLVARDINKTFFSELAKSRPNIIIVDFLDEVFGFYRHQISGALITNSNYLSRCNCLLFSSDDWVNIDRQSDEAWKHWESGCRELNKSIASDTRVVLVRLYLSEKYKSGDSVTNYSSRFVERIRNGNKILERCYKRFADIIDCHVVDVPDHMAVTQTAEINGFNPSNFSDSVYSHISKKIGKIIDLEGLVSESQSEKVGRLFDLFEPILDAGEVPSIYELYGEGKKFLENGDVKRARWCERLITLLRNSSVPLTVKLGQVTFGYGGIGVVIHANCQLGNFVNIGTNVTLGGGQSNIDSNGAMRNVPVVENRVYIGTGAKLIGGITIGSHSIIGANAVVTRDVPPFSVVAGNPSKIINKIDRSNIAKYAGYLYKRLPLNEVVKIMFGDGNDK